MDQEEQLLNSSMDRASNDQQIVIVEQKIDGMHSNFQSFNGDKFDRAQESYKNAYRDQTFSKHNSRQNQTKNVETDSVVYYEPKMNRCTSVNNMANQNQNKKLPEFYGTPPHYDQRHGGGYYPCHVDASAPGRDMRTDANQQFLATNHRVPGKNNPSENNMPKLTNLSK